MRIIGLTSSLFLSFVLIMFPQTEKGSGLKIGTNYRIYPSNVNQWEVSIVASPVNKDILFASANAVTLNPFFISEGIYVTTSGGNTWFGNDTCTGQIITFHAGDPGIVIDKNGTFILTRKSSFTGIYSHYSTDNGISWSNQLLISNDDIPPEKASLVSDNSVSSTYFGRSYASWVKLTSPYPLVIAYTDNGAQSWSNIIQINNPVNRPANSELAIDRNGKLFACWAALTNSSPFTEDYVGLATSTNGGNSWSVDENVFDINGIAGLLAQKSNIRINGVPRIAVDTSGGSRNGWIYVVTGQQNLSPAGSDPDIILNRSTDGGQTWSSGIRVNQDQINNGKIQLFPAIHVDKYGGINILFYDDRNTTSDSSGVFLARSDDGGNTWGEYEISDHNFKPTPISGYQGKMGDNIGITSSNEKIWPVWMDNSTGIYQVWTVPIEISSVGIKDESQFVKEFQLEQNFPNPFNYITNIQFSLTEPGFTRLTVYDLLGNEIIVLLNEQKQAGRYQLTFEAEQLNSGIYFYKLTSGHYSEVRKLVLLK